MNLVDYVKDKFNPTRPMGRKNWIYTSIVYFVIYFPSVWFLPGMDQLPAPTATVLLLSIFGAPFILLNCRRANAAGLPVIFVLASWFLTPINLMTEGGIIEHAINWYQFALLVLLVFMKNKVEPVSP